MAQGLAPRYHAEGGAVQPEVSEAPKKALNLNYLNN